MVEQYTVPRYN